MYLLIHPCIGTIVQKVLAGNECRQDKAAQCPAAELFKTKTTEKSVNDFLSHLSPGVPGIF